MNIYRIHLVLIIISLLSITFSCSYRDNSSPQVQEAAGVINRVLPEYADQFILKLIEKEKGNDIFEIEPQNKKIIIRGSSGIAICSGFNYYLKNYCNSVYNWRCGSNLNIKGSLPSGFKKVRKVTPYQYRYIFNYCTFSYSMAFWDWSQWEKMIDWMAMNGINMPLAPMGQEIIWQRVYKKYGISEEDLKDFFVGPAYNAFGRMGCIDGFGGPLPQSWIENENILQKKILSRERQLGMTPVLQGFTGHIPPALAKKNPGLKFTNLVWLDFPATYLLDWEDPLFTQISKDFITEQTKEYGTDHLYAIDQFIEMEPTSRDTVYLKNMSREIFSSIDQADPEGKWVIQTWPFKTPEYWNKERTKAYFGGVPDNRMIALELMGESWKYTGWYKHEGWYGKPWIWSVISNFGDNVSMFGGVTQIADNLQNALSSSDRGDLAGMGMMMEGLDYNPVTYELVSDLMWESSVPDLKVWKRKFLKSRYGNLNDTIISGWDHLFNYYYTQSGLFEVNPIIKRPFQVKEDIWPSEDAVSGARDLMAASSGLQDIDAYRYDIVNLFRQVFGQYAGHLLYEITINYQDKNINQLDTSVNEFLELSHKLEELMTTREEFLFGKWIDDSRKHATNPKEKELYEWNARAIITTWGGRILYGYAIKDWAGLYSRYYLPRWEKLFAEMRSEITGGKKLDYKRFEKDMISWEDNWVGLHEENLVSAPTGNSIAIAKQIWDQYGIKLLNQK
ncbi:MAG: alpha-N-acetylglucosaminidase [Bacteroidales bacterium]|nr:alpha-N-acetylglucosaminidase [Bacteroidales bacterium]